MIQIYRTDKDKNNWEFIAPHYDTDQFKTIMNYSITHTSNNKKMNWTQMMQNCRTYRSVSAKFYD